MEAVRQRLQHVAAMARGDVDNAHRRAGSAQAGDRIAQQLLDMHLALADAAPADGVQVIAVDHRTDAEAPPRLVAIDVVQRGAGVEAGLVPQPHAIGQQAAQLQAGPRQGPVHASRAGRRQRPCEPVRLLLECAAAVRVQQRDRRRRCLELAHDKAPCRRHGRGAIALAQGVMVKAVQHDAFLDGRAQPLVERVLRRAVNHPVGTGNQQLRRHGDGRCIGHDALRRLIEVQQDIDGNRARDQRVLLVAGDAPGIVRQEPGLDVAVDEELAAQPVHQFQARTRQRHVELDLEGRRRQHQAADPRRVIVHPGCGQDRAHALRHHRDALHRNAVDGGDMVDEGLDVAHRGGQAGAVAPLPRRASMAARIPREESVAGQVQFIHQVGDTARMLVPAMKQDHGA